MNRIYNSPHAWGKTYGEHKEFLEFTDEQFITLQNYANEIGIIFTASAMDRISLKKLLKMNVPFIKIGSGDANNLSLLREAAASNVPCVVSTGMQTKKTVDKIVQIFDKKQFCLMHCVSSYPTLPKDVGLKRLKYYRNIYPDILLGYSGHEKGIFITQAAVLMGSVVIERHFTLDKSLKGSDHCVSLTPVEFEDLIYKIRQIETTKKSIQFETNEIIQEIQANNLSFTENDDIIVREALMDISEKQILNCENPCYDKLGKTLVFTDDFYEGHVLNDTNICAKVSDSKGLPPEYMDDIIGQYLICDVIKDSPVYRKYLSL